MSLLLLSLTSSSLIPSHAPTLIHLLTTLTGAPAGKRMIIFVDDLNMPKLDTYGSQPPIELLRQYQDFAGLYDREKLFWKEIHVSFLFACHSFHHDPVSIVSFLVLCASCPVSFTFQLTHYLHHLAPFITPLFHYKIFPTIDRWCPCPIMVKGGICYCKVHPSVHLTRVDHA